MRHFDGTFWWDILMRHLMRRLIRLLMRHFDETFWCHILMRHLLRHLKETCWLDILMKGFDGTFWCDILMKHFDDKFWWDILLAGNGWKFVLNFSILHDMWHGTHDMWYVTCDTWHVTGSGRKTFSQNLSSLALTVWEWRYDEDILTNHDWNN